MAGTLQWHSGAAVTARLFFVAGWRAHMALFRWMRPSAFIPTVLGVPLVQLIWFVHLGDYIDAHPVEYYAIGNALHACAVVGLFAPAMSVQGERFGGTLTAVLASPARREVMFLGRVLPAVLFGALTSAVMLSLGTVLADVRIEPGQIPALAATLVVTAVSCSACGLVIGAIGLRTREALIAGNLVSYFMLLVSGINVPQSNLPGWLALCGDVLPMSHGIQAARDVLAGVPGVGGLLLLELAKAAGYLLVALLMLRALERSSRRHAILDEV
ncbi:hypothetical protein N566_04845 [Streptomycetaceae bacterium MP113-05]|nr:hypothetical protein N566_04845 [Streptomycetaceae bacterium MP113-05]